MYYWSEKFSKNTKMFLLKYPENFILTVLSKFRWFLSNRGYKQSSETFLAVRSPKLLSHYCRSRLCKTINWSTTSRFLILNPNAASVCQLPKLTSFDSGQGIYLEKFHWDPDRDSWWNLSRKSSVLKFNPSALSMKTSPIAFHQEFMSSSTD